MENTTEVRQEAEQRTLQPNEQAISISTHSGIRMCSVCDERGHHRIRGFSPTSARCADCDATFSKMRGQLELSREGSALVKGSPLRPRMPRGSRQTDQGIAPSRGLRRLAGSSPRNHPKNNP